MVGAVSLRDVDAALNDPSVRSDDNPMPASWPGLGRQVQAALGAHSIAVPATARIGVAVAVGVGVGRVLGLGHAYWVGLTAAAVLQGTNLAVVRRRFGYRLAGTAPAAGAQRRVCYARCRGAQTRRAPRPRARIEASAASPAYSPEA
jgi:uncharacterized membrane protein YccC